MIIFIDPARAITECESQAGLQKKHYYHRFWCSKLYIYIACLPRNVDKAVKSYLNEKKTKMLLVVGAMAIGVLAAIFVGSFPPTTRAIAQESDLQHPMMQNNSILKPTVSTAGTASTNVKPDKVSVTVGVETNGTTAQEAASRNSDLMDQVIAALKGLGIEDEQMSTSSYSVFPVYESTQPEQVCPETYPPPPECIPKQEIVGYRASNSLTVTLDVEDTAGVDAGKVIDTAVEAGANNVGGVFFFLSEERQGEIRDNLIKDAIANAKHRADIAADAVGQTVSGVHSINLNEVYFPVFFGKSATSEDLDASAPTQVLPGEQQVTTTVNVVYYMSDILAAP
ncbi:MAG: SIMPL domain-containing protein [Nitrososphaera sp.]|nr:SIMPL domain-containing protein [Nitrososphaera sp.]